MTNGVSYCDKMICMHRRRWAECMSTIHTTIHTIHPSRETGASVVPRALGHQTISRQLGLPVSDN